MKYISVVGNAAPVSFSEALTSGLAPDGGLFIPETIPRLPGSILEPSPSLTLDTAGVATLSSFIPEIPRAELLTITKRAWDFPLPLVKLNDELYILELFHGPTLAFKDFGARFMARALSFILGRQHRRLTILVATSGDTGGAVAHGFFNVPNITVYILYPAGRVSNLQEQQMTTLGGNIKAVEVEGSFDDCQAIVKRALGDHELVARHGLTTANSINIGRLLPQTCYYVWGVMRWKYENRSSGDDPTVVVPSGNLGNLTAAVYAKALGVPIMHLVAATNENKPLPEYLQSGVYTPAPSTQTLSNAMDVGNPSNIVRLQSLYNNNIDALRKNITAISISDAETIDEMRRTFAASGYILDPHTAVGVAAARKVRGWHPHRAFIVAGTAHPGKFPDVIQTAIGRNIPPPDALREALHRKKITRRIKAGYGDFTSLLETQSGSQ